MRQRRIKRGSSDGCDTDDSTVGKKESVDGRGGVSIRRLRMSDQRTPGHETDRRSGDEDSQEGDMS